jgi:hypothetical protein
MANIRVADRLSFGCQQTCTREDDGSLAVVHACKIPCHRDAVGYRNTLPTYDPNYLAFEDAHHLYLNLIDPTEPLFQMESFEAFFRFVDREIEERDVLIHCNKGESRSPSLALLYMAKRLGLLPNESYKAAATSFEEQFPYSPSQGIRTWLSRNWHRIDFQKEPGDESAFFYHLDFTGSSLSPGLVMQLAPVPPDVEMDERKLLETWFPDGLTHFGADIALRRLEPWALERELELERARRERFCSLPSRYTSVFACRSPDEIEQLRWQFDAPGFKEGSGRVWKVEGKKIFRADMNLFKYYSGDMATAADLYWSQEESHDPLYEYLLETPVKVLCVAKMIDVKSAIPDQLR